MTNDEEGTEEASHAGHPPARREEVPPVTGLHGRIRHSSFRCARSAISLPCPLVFCRRRATIHPYCTYAPGVRLVGCARAGEGDYGREQASGDRAIGGDVRGGWRGAHLLFQCKAGGGGTAGAGSPLLG